MRAISDNDLKGVGALFMRRSMPFRPFMLGGHQERGRRAGTENTTNISFGYVEGEAILLMLDQLGICASSGSACTSGSLEPSHVLRAMGVPFTFAHGSIRFSLSRFNTQEEVDFILEHMPPIIENLRKLSPFSKDSGPDGFACAHEGKTA